MGALRDAGWEITEDWCASEASLGVEDGDLDDETARRVAARDIEGIRHADVFWLVAPERPSFGASFELGHAVCQRSGSAIGPRIIISGPCSSIFARLADRRYPTHLDALRALTEPVNG
jgi:hypothetical protein